VTSGSYAGGGSFAAGADETGRPDVENRTVGELLGKVTTDLSTLMRQEVELAKVEIKEEATETAKAGAMLGAGGLVGYLALLILLLAAAWALAEALPLWASLLIVGVLTAIVAAVLISVGRSKLSAIPAAPNTIETLQEDVTWAKQQIS